VVAVSFSYTAEQIARTYQLIDLHQVNLLGSVTWAFEFEGQPWFYGFRDLATNGVNKPVMNTFRMLGQMSGNRVAVTSTGGLSLEQVRDSSVHGRADVSALAARDTRSATVLVWNYHDDDLPAPPAEIELAIDGLPAGPATLTQYRVDPQHGNSYTTWQAMGSPQPPSETQIAELVKASELAVLEGPKQVSAGDGRVVTSFTLPRQGVALVKLTW
jgi:xylan 1,4-beta-xylosidase